MSQPRGLAIASYGLCGWLLSSVLAIPAVAQVTFGTPAPALQVEQWAAGEPVGEFRAGQTYVVFFGATWAPSSLASLPRVIRLQTEHAGKLQVVGIISDRASWLQRFLQRPAYDVIAESTLTKPWGEIITFPLAVDPSSQTLRAYRGADQSLDLPHTVIIGGDGKVQWQGHPGLLNEPLQQVLDGSWTAEKNDAEMQGRQRLLEQSTQTLHLFSTNHVAEAMQQFQTLEPELRKYPAFSGLVSLLSAKTNQTSMRNEQLIEQAHASWDNPFELNQVAWEMVTEVPEKLRDTQRAYEFALRANQLTNSTNAAYLDTLARVLYERGDLAGAIATQQQAVAQESNSYGSPIAVTQGHYRKQLEFYEAAAAAQSTNDSPPGNAQPENAQPEIPAAEANGESAATTAPTDQATAPTVDPTAAPTSPPSVPVAPTPPEPDR